jgi:hypothetical protein
MAKKANEWRRLSANSPEVIDANLRELCDLLDQVEKGVGVIPLVTPLKVDILEMLDATETVN